MLTMLKANLELISHHPYNPHDFSSLILQAYQQSMQEQ